MYKTLGYVQNQGWTKSRIHYLMSSSTHGLLSFESLSHGTHSTIYNAKVCGDLISYTCIISGIVHDHDKKIRVSGLGARKYIYIYILYYYIRRIYCKFTTTLTEHLNLNLSLKFLVFLHKKVTKHLHWHTHYRKSPARSRAGCFRARMNKLLIGKCLPNEILEWLVYEI